MLRRATVLVVPLVSVALLMGGTPALAEPVEPAPVAPRSQESVRGQGPTEPAAFPDETAGASEGGRAAPPDGSAEVELVPGRWAPAGDLPVRVKGVGGSPRRVRVTFSTGDDVAERGGAAAVLVERLDGSTTTAPVRLALDTEVLSRVFRANFVHRLRLATLPACVALLHPHVDHGRHKSRAYGYGKAKHCPQAEPVEVPVTDELGDGELEFDATAGAEQESTEEVAEDPTVEPTEEPTAEPTEEPTPEPTAKSGKPAALRSATTGTSAGTAFVVSAGPSGSAGSFAATPLAPSSTWQVGEQSGDFATSYAVPVPPAPAGGAPSVELSYSSQAVDGRTSATNNQASWVGLGWDYEPGSVQRRYGGCAADGHLSVGDLCWKTDNAVLTLGGRSVPLYKASNGLWHPASDSGVRVQLLTGAPNGVRSGQYWLVTDRDGTRYWFGFGRQPTTNAATGSAWTVPVFGDDVGEPCHASTFAASRCQQGWRWNLDRVVDVHGNATTFFYAPETNRYGRLASPSLYTSYTRGGTLSRIDYGQFAGRENNPAPARITFGTAYRCTSASCAAPTTATASAFPDVPVDLICADSYCAGQYTPVFFDTKRLSTITTSVRTGSGYRTVDVVTLKQSFPNPQDGTDATLWLSSLTRTGVQGSSRTSLPPVIFAGQLLANRVDTNLAAGVVPLNMYRVKTVKGELGAQTSVGYGRPRPCVKTALPAPASNTRDCYPAYWVPASGPAGFGWFHKYLVTSVTVTDPVAGGPPMVTRYGYLGGAAWHHDENQIDPAKTQSFGLWRGYGTTTVSSGTAVKSTTRSLWFRGMNGDPLPGGAVRTARVTDSAGTAVADSEWLAGLPRERRELSAAGVELSGTLTGYYTKRTVDGPGLYDAFVVLPGRIDGRTRVTNPVSRAVSTRRTRERISYDPTYSQPTAVYADGDLATTSDDVCALSSYVRNTSSWLIDTPNVEQLRSGTCAGVVLSRTEHYYDGHALTAVPTRGNQTQSRTLKTGTVYVSTGAGYDIRGRIVSTTNGNRRITRTALTDAYPYGPVARVVSTNPLGHPTTVTFEAGRGLVTSATDPNGHTSSSAYDALGRVTKVWRPGTPVSGSPSSSYQYAVRQSAPSTVISDTRQDAGTVLRQVSYLDALGRPVETATPADGGRTVVATRYDDRGLVAASTGPLFTASPLPTSGSSVGAMLRPVPASIPSETRTSYDELGRPTVRGLWSAGVLQHRSTAAYFGGATVTTGPVGSASRSYVDALGRTTRLEQLHDGRSLPTTYSYDRLGRLLTVTDTGGNVSRFGYDLLGRQVSTSTPDAGSSSMTFDDDGNVTATRDARGQVITTSYDPLDRPTGRHAGGTALASFSYDRPGQLGLPATSTTADGFTVSVDDYDTRSRPGSRTLSVPDSEGLLAGSWTTRIAYDDADQVTAVELPAVADLPAERVTSGHDGYGRPTTLTGLQPYLTATSYDGLSRVSQRVLGAGAVQRSYGYDTATGRLTQLDATVPSGPVQADRIGYDPVGNVTQVTDLTGQSQCNRYDDLQRLVHAWTTSTSCTDQTAPSGSGPAPYDVRYRLADTGQLLGRTAGTDPERTYSYPAPGAGVLRPHAVTSVDGAEYRYDAAGQLEARTGGGNDLTLTWGPEATISTATTAGGTESYAYSTSGTRILRRGSTSSTLDLGGTELTLTGTTLTARRYYSNAGSVVAVRTAAGVSWLLGDRQGGPAVSISESGAVQRQQFGPYGETRVNEQTDIIRGFLNKPHDTSTGLTVLDHRSYDSDLARFLSPDPLYDPFTPGSFDAYGYAHGNPTTASDPSGLKCWGPDAICNAAKGIGGTVKDAAVGTVQTVRHPGRILDNYQDKCGTCSGIGGFLTIFNDFNPVAPIVNFAGNTITGANKGNIVKDLFRTLTVTALAFSPLKATKFSPTKAVTSHVPRVRMPNVTRNAASNGTAASRAAAEGGDALLSTASRGAGKSLPMNMQTVCDVACKYKIDISDVPININKARAGYAGSTSSNGTITLTRSAFVNEEQLARTLAHERFHVDQIRSGMGYPTTYDAGNAWEQAAQAFEDAWWAGQ